jgi:hypothetical protein
MSTTKNAALCRRNRRLARQRWGVGTCQSFVGFGDADPSNVAFLVHGAEMRVAETRTVNRALRKAYGIGICSIEEVGSLTKRHPPLGHRRSCCPKPVNGNYGGPKVRDRLCQLIRQHQLDAHLVKSYAVDFCGAKALLDATREQVEGFVAHLVDWAEKDRDALLCQLNSYPACQGGRMTRRFQGLNQTVQPAPGELPDGLYLVRVEKAQYRWHAHKPFYVLRLSVLEPQEFAGQTLSGQLYCAAKALWKLGWFLRDFAYDADLLGRDEVDEKPYPGCAEL